MMGWANRRMRQTPRSRAGLVSEGRAAGSVIRVVNHNPLNFLCTTVLTVLAPGAHSPRSLRCSTVRAFVPTRYRNASAASSPPIPSSFASTFSTSSGRFGSCAGGGTVSSGGPERDPARSTETGNRMGIDMGNTFLFNSGLFPGPVVQRTLLRGATSAICELGLEGPAKDVPVVPSFWNEPQNRLPMGKAIRTGSCSL
jgi:hypothetical protein